MIFLYAFLILAAVAASLSLVYIRVRRGRRGKAPLLANIFSFFGVMAVIAVGFLSQGAAAVTEAAAVGSDGLSTGLGYIAAALSVGISSLGGGIAVKGGVFTLLSGSVSYNSASSRGGGLYLAGGKAKLTGGSVSVNEAQYGGGAFIAGGRLSMPENIIIDNTATLGGAGLGLSGVNLSLPFVACVRGNTINGAEADYWLQDGATFSVTEQLDKAYRIYVSAAMQAGVWI